MFADAIAADCCIVSGRRKFPAWTDMAIHRTFEADTAW
jgi:hypothetical protein